MAFDLQSFVDKVTDYFRGVGQSLNDSRQQYNSWDPTLQNIYSYFVNLNDKTNNAYSGVLGNLANYFNNQDYIGLQGYLSSLQASSGNTYNFFEDMPQLESWINNLINKQNVASERSWEQEMRDTEYTSIADQLQKIGLSGSSVLQTSGASHNAVSSPAAASRNQIDLRRYNEQQSLAKSLLSMTSSMASAGVYGSAIGAARKASGAVASAASHSAFKALKKSSSKPVQPDTDDTPSLSWEEMIKELEQENPVEPEYPF